MTAPIPIPGAAGFVGSGAGPATDGVRLRQRSDHGA
jgi:hypothetical protein